MVDRPKQHEQHYEGTNENPAKSSFHRAIGDSSRLFVRRIYSSMNPSFSTVGLICFIAIFCNDQIPAAQVQPKFNEICAAGIYV
jgi:hypothetical protein